VTVRVITGDVRQVLRTLPAGSVQMGVTSPPYWNLRSYLAAGHPLKHLEIGCERTVHDWVRTMAAVFGEMKRVLRPDGVLFLNLGDSYAGARSGPDTGSTLQGTRHNQNAAKQAKQMMTASRRRDDHEIPRSDFKSDDFKVKDMHGQPWRAALALQGHAVIACKTVAQWADMLQAARAACDWEMVAVVEQRLRAWDFTEALQGGGWYLRQEIIWAKTNAMPESVVDRCTKSHEHIFLLAKSKRYFFDADAIAEQCADDTEARYSRGRSGAHKHADGGPGGQTIARTFDGMARRRLPGNKTHSGVDAYEGGDSHHRTKAGLLAYSDRIAADLAAGNAGATRNRRSVWTMPTAKFSGAHFAVFPEQLARTCILAGSRIGDTVLDPFGGSGTVGLVADELRRDAILIDLDERCAPMAADRISTPAPLLAEVTQ
jgi:DNA modification methylase